MKIRNIEYVQNNVIEIIEERPLTWFGQWKVTGNDRIPKKQKE